MPLMFPDVGLRAGLEPSLMLGHFPIRIRVGSEPLAGYDTRLAHNLAAVLGFA
ncbi:MAG: hypothetical protein RMI91_05830 [Gemmatales bacterium]|nr:hypothetical protein [Gemmatales bacterium]MDW7994155.1 hypothetical protein [Gemmatales bacterium]